MDYTLRLQRDILHTLALLLFSPEEPRLAASRQLKDADREYVEAFTWLASVHHVVVRAVELALDDAVRHHEEPAAWVAELRKRELLARPQTLLAFAQVCSELEDNGFPTVVIKSLEHWPDMGSDFDIYARGEGSRITVLLQSRFSAEPLPQTVADRLAKKRKFRIPGVEKPIEIYAGRLGQTGEHLRLAKLLRKRRVARTIEGFNFYVPSREDRIAVAVLDRFYRHHDLRLCDVADTAGLLQEGPIDFDQLKLDTKRAGIWPGVRSFLSVVDRYYSHYSGRHLPLPSRVLRKAEFDSDKLIMQDGLLRIPLIPQGARLYARNLSKAIRRRDLKKSVRIGLLPVVTLASKSRSHASEQLKTEAD